MNPGSSSAAVGVKTLLSSGDGGGGVGSDLDIVLRAWEKGHWRPLFILVRGTISLHPQTSKNAHEGPKRILQKPVMFISLLGKQKKVSCCSTEKKVWTFQSQEVHQRRLLCLFGSLVGIAHKRQGLPSTER